MSLIFTKTARNIFRIPRVTYNITKCVSVSTKNTSYDRNTNKTTHYLLLASAGVTCFSIYYLTNNKKKVSNSTIDIRKPESILSNFPTFTTDEVAKHNNKDNRIWVTYRDGVYDITDFVEMHPGGDKILMAAGGSLEPFWAMYAVHKTSEILEILEDMRIGNLKEEKMSEGSKSTIYDPYENEPIRHPSLKPVSQKPFNAECPPDVLVENYKTPNDLFFVRNHLPVPEIDPHSYELELELEDSDKKLVLSLDELKKFPKHSVEATIMCAGNRRSEMMKVKNVKGLEWGSAAVGNAVWSGAKLKDVLLTVGVDESSPYNHIQFEGYDVDVTNNPYGASVPFWKGVDNRCEVILAYEMNGEPLPRDHGYPVRVIIPGVVGARNVKWLNRIILSKHESDAHWQQNDYKGFNPSTDWDTVDFTKSPAIQELPVISAICSPKTDQKVKVENGFITIKGYAWSGGGLPIVRIDVTNDQGKTWFTGTIDEQSSKKAPNHFSWTLWSCKIPVNAGEEEMEIWSKAVDSNYNTQPESFQNIWNLRGVLNNAYHRIKITLEHSN